MFSIVVPVYNKRDTLSKTVASVLAQSFGDFELILVDDGSTDGSMATVDGVEDPRLRRLAQRNQGPGPARNAGAAAALHDWIALLDADDVWSEDHLAELDRVRRAHPEAGLVGTSYHISDREAGGACVGPTDGQIGLVDYFNAVADGDALLCASTAAVRRDVWQESGGFADYPSGQDSELWVRIASHWPVATSRRVTATYVRRADGITRRRRQRSFGQPPRTLADLSPAVKRVLELRSGAPAAQRRGYDRFVDRYLHWQLRAAVHDGDVATIRGLRSLYERRPSRADRALLRLAALPTPVARALYGAGTRLGVRTRLRTLRARRGSGRRLR